MIKIKHSHGVTETHTDLESALAALRSVYGHEIETEGELSEGRVLVWQDAEAARNDDGQRAVAEIRGSEVGAWRIEEERGDYVNIVDPDHCDEAMIRVMQDYVDEHEPTHVSIVIRLWERRGEVCGTYQVNRDGTLQILGYSLPVPDSVGDVLDAAWEAACGPQPGPTVAD